VKSQIHEISQDVYQISTSGVLNWQICPAAILQGVKGLTPNVGFEDTRLIGSHILLFQVFRYSNGTLTEIVP
jgi:hypothetical protein